MTPNDDNNLIAKLQDKLTAISMTADEKQSIRHKLENKLQETRSETSARQLPAWLDRLRRLPQMFGRAAVGFAAMLFLVGGLTYAAEDALPGSPLYTVKKNVNEALITVTSFSDSRQAATQSKLAARRINELQALINSGQLTTTTSQELLNDIAAHTKMARQNIADLEATGDKKHEQAVELRSQLTALLAAESESLESVVATTTGATSSSNELARQAARKLIAIAKEDPDFSVSQQGTLTEAALTDLLQITVDRLDDAYKQYKNQYDTTQTPPPKALVAAAHDLETALQQIRSEEYEVAVDRLQSLLNQLDGINQNLADSAAEKATSSDVSSTTLAASSTSNQSQNATSSVSQSATSTRGEPAVTSPVPSKQNLQNQTITEIIREVRSYIDKTRDTDKNATSTNPGPKREVKKTADPDTATSSSATSTQTNSTASTSSENKNATSSGPQQGDESRL
jgi:hypothetical protein